MIYRNKNLPALGQLINKIKRQTFSIQTQYKFLKINQVIQDELELYEQQKSFLITNYADYDEYGQPIMLQGGGIKIKEEYVTDCVARIEEINSIEISFPDIYFSLDELEPLQLTLGELELLAPFIKN